MPVIMDKWQEVGHRSLGYRFRKDGKPLCGEMKCPICGKWFSWSETNVERFLLERRWNFRKGEPEHCGSSHCYDYHMRYLKHQRRLGENQEYREQHFIEQKKRTGMHEKNAFKLFERLKQKGVVV